jgi:2-dehydropantoate 2-reductase
VRHAVVGAGGIGGLISAALARANADVMLLMRPATLSTYGGRVSVESAVLGDFDIEVPAASALDREVDIVWVATKATQLDPALELAPPERVGEAIVIPLLNGVDHLAILQARYPSVVAGAIRVESERVAPARIRQSSPFLRVELAGAEAAAADLRTAGIECRVRDDGPSLLWDKLAFLAPIALATTAFDAPLGAVRDDERYRDCQMEAVAVARAEGARIDEHALQALQQNVPGEMRSSMQKDVTAGREPELDAIAGPILRGGARHDVAVPATTELAHIVSVRAGTSEPM